MLQRWYRLHVQERELLRPQNGRNICILHHLHTLPIISCRKTLPCLLSRQHVIPRVQRLRQKRDLRHKYDPKKDNTQPLNPLMVHKPNKPTNKRPNQQPKINSKNPQSHLLSSLMLEEHIVEDSKSHRCRRTNAKPLEKPRRHIPIVRRCQRRTDTSDERDDSPRYEDNATTDDVGEGGPEERAESEAKGRDGDGPVDFFGGEVVLRLEGRKGGDGCGGDVGEHEVAGRFRRGDQRLSADLQCHYDGEDGVFLEGSPVERVEGVIDSLGVEDNAIFGENNFARLGVGGGF